MKVHFGSDPADTRIRINPEIIRIPNYFLVEATKVQSLSQVHLALAEACTLSAPCDLISCHCINSWYISGQVLPVDWWSVLHWYVPVRLVHSRAGCWWWYAWSDGVSQRHHRSRITHSQEPHRQVHCQRVCCQQWTSCRHTSTHHYIRVSSRRPTAIQAPTLLWTPAQRKRASMLYFANVLFIYFFMAALFSGPGERRFAKVLNVVDLECHWRSYYLDFFLVILKLQGGPKSDEISHIFRPRPQTFCSHA